MLCGMSQEMRNTKMKRGKQRRNEEYEEKMRYTDKEGIRSTKERKNTKK